jgi:hypothetical protein
MGFGMVRVTADVLAEWFTHGAPAFAVTGGLPAGAALIATRRSADLAAVEFLYEHANLGGTAEAPEPVFPAFAAPPTPVSRFVAAARAEGGMPVAAGPARPDVLGRVRIQDTVVWAEGPGGRCVGEVTGWATFATGTTVEVKTGRGVVHCSEKDLRVVARVRYAVGDRVRVTDTPPAAGSRVSGRDVGVFWVEQMNALGGRAATVEKVETGRPVVHLAGIHWSFLAEWLTPDESGARAPGARFAVGEVVCLAAGLALAHPPEPLGPGITLATRRMTIPVSVAAVVDPATAAAVRAATGPPVTLPEGMETRLVEPPAPGGGIVVPPEFVPLITVPVAGAAAFAAGAMVRYTGLSHTGEVGEVLGPCACKLCAAGTHPPGLAVRFAEWGEQCVDPKNLEPAG